MLLDATLPPQYWTLTLNHIEQIINCTPSKANFLNKLASYEAVYDRRPNVKFFTVFGAHAIAQIPRQHREPNKTKLNDGSVKLGPQGIDAIIVGQKNTGYDLINPRDGTFFSSGDVRILQTGNLQTLQHTLSDVPLSLQPPNRKQLTKRGRKKKGRQDVSSLKNPNLVVGNNNLTVTSTNSNSITNPIANTRSFASVLSITSVTPTVNNDTSSSIHETKNESVSDLEIFQEGNDLQDHTYAFAILDDTAPQMFGYSLPQNYTAACQSPFADQWQQAIQTEFENHYANNPWTIVPQTQAMKMIPSKWCLSFKYAQNGG